MSGIQTLPDNTISTKPVKTITNFWSAGGKSLRFCTGTTTTVNVGAIAVQGKNYTPSLTAATPATILSITGSGEVDLVAAIQLTSFTAKTIRLKITTDGNVIFDATSGTFDTGGYDGCLAYGDLLMHYLTAPNIGVMPGNTLLFNSSFLLEATSSTTDAYTTFVVNYRTT